MAPTNLCSNDPGHATQLTLRLDPRTLGEIWSGDTTISAALKDGRLSVAGDPGLVRSLSPGFVPVPSRTSDRRLASWKRP